MPLKTERFLSPGTWTCPSGTTTVRVTVVGGGGGAHARSPVPLTGGPANGGGGGVYRTLVPVSGPVPVVVGAGGLGNTPSTPNQPPAMVGGTSSFGPISVGGGGGGQASAPPTGGGSGGPVPIQSGFVGGTYGYPSAPPGRAGGARGNGPMFTHLYGFGAAGNSGEFGAQKIQPATTPTYTTPYAGAANTGAGGTGVPTAYPNVYPLNGGSGIVIVEWWE